MKIHSLRLTSFGKFKNKTIALSDGINLIYGKNEAGKSTVMAFIKAMLYGFNGRGADGDRKRYIPWDGGGLSGEMEVTLPGGRRVVIIRSAGRTPAQ
ncbi:MAG: chromosome segregation protein SMC, partial [Ruminococcaceae bacterium]|nr:chromosome segregation protein SMC [Oscillospiraceae bacterium]